MFPLLTYRRIANMHEITDAHNQTARMALNGLLSAGYHKDHGWAECAKAAYNMADAMIEHRNSRNNAESETHPPTEQVQN
jgi:hypothetical protein